MKKITVITTGGTIGSILKSDSAGIDSSSQRVFEEIQQAGISLNYSIEIVSPLNKNSESFTPSDWVKVLRCISEANDSDADGIVVTHGTDTMAHTIAAALVYSNIWSKTVCFTGAFLPPEHSDSDTSLNLRAALAFAANPNSADGIFLAFRANQFNSEAKIIDGADIKPMMFDDLLFNSAYDETVSTFTPVNGFANIADIASAQSESQSHPQSKPQPKKNPCIGTTKFPDEDNINQAQSNIACLTLYPGIDQKLLEAVAKDRKVLILEMYHSGTGPAGINVDNGEQSDLINFIQSQSKDITILMGAFPKKHIEPPYDSTKQIKQAGAHIYADLQTHLLYAFSLLCLSSGFSGEEIVRKLSDWEI